MANTFYVATTGNDVSGDGSLALPYATVNYTLTLATAGDTIYLRGGTYNQRIYVNSFTATALNPLTIQNYNNETVIIAGTSGVMHCIFVLDSDYIVIDGIDCIYNYALTPPDWKMAWCRIQGFSNHCTYKNFLIQRDWVNHSGVAQTPAQEYAARRDVGVSIGANCSYITIGADVAEDNRGGNSEIIGVNKGIQLTDLVLYTTVKGVNIHDCMQNATDLQEMSTTTRSGTLFTDCYLSGSYNEDGGQTHHTPGDTGLTSIRGFTFRRCTIDDNSENALDFKNSRDVLVEDCVVRGTWGSSGGQFGVPASGNLPNRRSMHAMIVGGNEPGFNVIQRNNRYYDNPAATTLQEGWTVYNCTFIRNKRDYTGAESAFDDSTGQFPYWASIVPTDLEITNEGGGPFTHIGIKNNVFANEASAGVTLRSGLGDVDIDWNAYANLTGKVGAVTDSSPYQVKALAAWRTWVQANGWSTDGEANSFELADVAACGYVNVAEHPTGDEANYDWTLETTSPLVATGGWLTRANGAGVVSTTLVVDNAAYFYDGWGNPDEVGDTIYIEGVGTKIVDSVDFSTDTITLTTTATWSDNAKIWWGISSTPDIGFTTGETSAPGGGGGGGGSTVVAFNSPVGLGVANIDTLTAVQTIPITGISTLSANPALMLIVTSGTASGTSANHALLSVGVGTLTASRTVAVRAEHGVNPADDGRKALDDGIILIQNPPNGAIVGRGTLTNITASEVTITLSLIPTSAYRMVAVVFNADDSYVGDGTLSTTVNTNVSFATGFEPTLAFVLSNVKPIPNTSGNASFILSLGVTDDVTQGCLAIKEVESSPTNVAAHLRDDYIFAEIGTSGILSKAGDIAFTSTSAFVTSRITGASANCDVALLALSWDNQDTYVGTFTSPPSSGDLAISGLPFAPGFVGFIGSMLSSFDTGSQTDAGSLGLGFAITDVQYAAAVAIADNSVTSDTESIEQDLTALLVHQGDGSAGYEVLFNEWTDDGVNLEWTINSGGASRQGLFFAVEGTGVTVTCAPAEITLTGMTPTVIKGAFTYTSTTPGPIALSTTTPTVQNGGTIIFCTPAEIALSSPTPTIILGPASFTMTPGEIALSTTTPTVTYVDLSQARILTLHRRRLILTCPRIVNMSSIREFIESPIEQGSNESISYTVDTRNWGGSPANPTCTLKKLQGIRLVDVSDTNLTGDCEVVGDYITTDTVTTLTAGKKYQFAARWQTADLNYVEAVCTILATE